MYCHCNVIASDWQFCGVIGYGNYPVFSYDSTSHSHNIVCIIAVAKTGVIVLTVISAISELVVISATSETRIHLNARKKGVGLDF